MGAGTGMMAFGLKAGVGTASRIIESEDAKYTLGVLVLSNFGRREDLRFLGKKIDLRLENEHNNREKNTGGSIIVVVATDAPLTSRQLNRICKRAPLGISRTGGYAAHGSGDVNENSKEFQKLLAATVDVTEEAILNSLLMAKTIDGRDNHEAPSLDINRLNED
ncbi:Beta-peptidyl aminopeptidase BapA [subsurface metagenome]